MAGKSAIEWCTDTWNPIVGCSVVSPGCTNCYAMKQAARIQRMTPSSHYAGTTQASKAGPVWTGKMVLAPDHILQVPLRWRRPRRIFVNSMGDLFHDAVPDEWIDRVFAIMALAHWQKFQVLTKRSARMRAYLSAHGVRDRIVAAAQRLAAEGKARAVFFAFPWPLPNIWLGVSAEDQRRADERVPDLLATPAAVRFVSAEPMLGAIDFRRLDIDGHSEIDALAPMSDADCWRSDWDPAATGSSLDEAIEGFRDQGFRYPPSEATGPRLDWIIVGGESGPGARPMHSDWVRGIRDPCAATGVAFFFKQWGEWAPDTRPQVLTPSPIANYDTGADQIVIRHDGSKNETWYADEPDSVIMRRVGKTRAGRLLDGVEHDAIPEVRP